MLDKAKDKLSRIESQLRVGLLTEYTYTVKHYGTKVLTTKAESDLTEARLLSILMEKFSKEEGYSIIINVSQFKSTSFELDLTRGNEL